jgi:hypothetical protein
MLDRPDVSEPTKSAGDDREQPSAAVRTMAAQGEVSRSLSFRQELSVTTTSRTSSLRVLKARCGTVVALYFRAK